MAIKYNQRIYELCVLETKPVSAVGIVECDMNVELLLQLVTRIRSELRSQVKELYRVRQK
jgi:hypothetical protein